MRVVLDFSRCGQRDNLFLEKASLLEELARFVVSAVGQELRGQPVRCFVDDLRCMAALTGCGLDTEYVAQGQGGKATGTMAQRIARLRRTRLAHVPSGEAVLWLSPLAGPVTPSRLRRFLAAADGKPALSMAPVHCNANPFWTFLLSPLSFNGQYYQDRNATQLPAFRPESNFIDQEQWRERLGDRSIDGSQWLPEVWRVDGALALDDGSGAAARSVPVEMEERLGDLPLLYALPLNDVARETPLSFTGTARSPREEA
ncbi:MAG: hypothetical protein V3573_04725 [Desulfovibrionaceae bacterium]